MESLLFPLFFIIANGGDFISLLFDNSNAGNIVPKST